MSSSARAPPRGGRVPGRRSRGVRSCRSIVCAGTGAVSRLARARSVAPLARRQGRVDLGSAGVLLIGPLVALVGRLCLLHRLGAGGGTVVARCRSAWADQRVSAAASFLERRAAAGRQAVGSVPGGGGGVGARRGDAVV